MLFNEMRPKTVTGTVVETRRAGYSSVGNPAFNVILLLTAIDGTPVEGSEAMRTVLIRTAANSSIGYAITNPEYAYQPHEYTLNGWGKLAYAKAVHA